jgi:hypothetical protein
MNTIRHWLTALAITTLAWVGTGCETCVTGGTRPPSASLKNLHLGLTYQEVIAELGPPLMKVDGERLIAYPWDTRGGEVPTNPLGVLASFACALIYADLDINTVEIHLRYHAWAFKFDGRQKLQDWKYFKTKTPEDRRRALLAWGKE